MRDQSRTEAFSVAELCRRGWTRPLVARILGAEDFTAPNPHVASGPDMRLYARARVEKAEKGAEFVAHADISKGRKQ